MMSWKIYTAILYCYLLSVEGYGQTYKKDIEPIILNKCAPCHRPGESAPFNLLRYEDVTIRGSFIKKVVQEGIMPPWSPDNDYVHFDNDRSLSQSEVDLIVKWVDKKMPRGSGNNNTPANTNAKVTAHRKMPNLTLTAQDSFLIKGDNEERFVVFKIPFEIPDSANVEAIEFFSTNKKLLHHANYGVYAVQDAVIDIHQGPAYVNLSSDEKYRYSEYLPLKKQIDYYGGWVPGASSEDYPPGIGWVFPKRGVILLTIHFAPNAKDEEVLNGVNLFFTDNPIDRKVQVINFGSGGIGEKEINPTFFMIPANKETKYSLTVSNPSEDFSLLYIWPHMHYIGKSFKSYAVTPTLDTIRLVNIPNWDYRWQELYRYKKFVRIPKGSKIYMECVYDNTANNPFNPFDPPQTIFSYGDMRSTQEMMTMLMIYLPYRQGDEEKEIASSY